MSSKLEGIATRLNTSTTQDGVTFFAQLQDDMVEVICSNNDEFPIKIVETDTQLITVSHLFSVDEVASGAVNELNGILLSLNPAIPLSSVGLQNNQYILFGAMALETTFDNLMHELAVQADNVIDLLDAVSPSLSNQ